MNSNLKSLSTQFGIFSIFSVQFITDNQWMNEWMTIKWTPICCGQYGCKWWNANSLASNVLNLRNRNTCKHYMFFSWIRILWSKSNCVQNSIYLPWDRDKWDVLFNKVFHWIWLLVNHSNWGKRMRNRHCSNSRQKTWYKKRIYNNSYFV